MCCVELGKMHVVYGGVVHCELQAISSAVGVHRYAYVYMGTVRPKSKQGNTTNMNISFSIENIKKSCSGQIQTHVIYTSYEADALLTECIAETGRVLREARPLVLQGASSWDHLQLLVWIHAYTCTYWSLESTFTLQGTLMQ